MRHVTDDDFDENGILKDGHRMRVPMMMMDARRDVRHRRDEANLISLLFSHADGLSHKAPPSGILSLDRSQGHTDREQ